MLVKLALSSLLLFSLTSEAFSREKFTTVNNEAISNKVLLVDIEYSGEKYSAQLELNPGKNQKHLYTLDFITTPGISIHSLPPNFHDSFQISFLNGSKRIIPDRSKSPIPNEIKGIEDILSYLFPLMPPDGVIEGQFISVGTGQSFTPLLGNALKEPLLVKAISDSEVVLQSSEKITFYDLQGIYWHYEILNELVQTKGTTNMKKSTTSITHDGKLIAKYTLEVL